jgi:tRNA/rRNA methyltransferase
VAPRGEAPAARTAASAKLARPAPSGALASVVVVLVEPSEPGNVGAVARVLLNLGAGALRLVVADRRRRARLVGAPARARARHARPLLAAATFHRDLRGALADVERACAFSARSGRFRAPRGTLDAVAHDYAGACGRRALVFGNETAGLSAADVEICADLVAIPAGGADPVLNLSHAVAIALWEFARARGGHVAPQNRHAPPRTATVAERDALRSDYDALLVLLGFPRRALGDLHGRILRRLTELLDRAGGEHADASMLRGLAVAIRRRLAAAPAASAAAGTGAKAPVAGRTGSSGSRGRRPSRSQRGAAPRSRAPAGSRAAPRA